MNPRHPARQCRTAYRRVGRIPRWLAATLLAPLIWSALGMAIGAGEPAHTNRLADSRDPYLLLHADNPVDWYPWGPEAMAKARREDKPIFLSVGYSTCFWCHVAERTLYSNPEIAASMNRWFVNVKVDREQLPDVDQVYMLARELLSGSGGWPNNLFLTPDLKPFFAGSYFPPQADGSGRPSFPAVLRAIHQAWSDRRDDVHRVANQVHDAMQQAQNGSVGDDEAPIQPAQWLARARQALLPRFDAIHGGLLGSQIGAKFPMSPILELLAADTRNQPVLDNLTRTLDAMARGGIHDHLAGGFHRYSVERTWSVPHFEKMLYDNAQLLKVYAEAFRVTGNPLYRLVAVAIGDYLSQRMSAPQGGLFTAEDSQVAGEEGASYLWTRAEIESILGSAEARRFFAVYDLAPMLAPPVSGRPAKAAGTDQPGVIRVRLETAATASPTDGLVDRLAALAPQRRKLLAVRDRRPQPARDDKIIVALNGLAIRAFAAAGTILRKPQYVALARRAAERVWALAYDPTTGDLKHQIFRGRAQTEGYLADYALFGGGLMALHEATGEAIWRRRAASLADALLRHFARPDGGLSVSRGGTDLLIVPEDTGDDVQPSGSSAAVDLLLRLAAATGDPRYATAAGRALRRLGGRVEQRPEDWPSAVLAVALQHPAAIDALASATDPAAKPDREPGPAAGFRLPDSADRVRLTATTRRAHDQDEIAIAIRVDDGYHINANPASLDYLVATTLAFDGLTPTAIAYPHPTRFKPAFATEALDVYEGSVKIRATFPKGVLDGRQNIRANVTVQACDDRTCLAPANLPVAVNGPGGGTD